MSARRDNAAVLAAQDVLRDRSLIGPMPWILAILMFITVLAAATGLSMGLSAYHLSSDVAQRLTVQIVEANADIRHAQTHAIAQRLGSTEGVASAMIVDEAKVAKLVEPWLGSDGIEAGLPYPSLIDVTLRPGAQLDSRALQADLVASAPSVHVEPDAQSLGPLVQLLGVMTWLAVSIVALMMVAVAAAVILSARAALNTHRATIDILHLMGSSDRQIASIFQRRIVKDALVSGAIGLAGAVLVLVAFQLLVTQTQSEFLGAALLPYWAWPLPLLLPLLATLLANSAARMTVMRALKAML